MTAFSNVPVIFLLCLYCPSHVHSQETIVENGEISVESMSTDAIVSPFNGHAEWNLDEKLQFVQTELASGYYQLEIRRLSATNFYRMSGFLMRKSYELCGAYHYQLTILSGVEEFDDRRSFPHMNFGSLVATVQCPKSASELN